MDELRQRQTRPDRHPLAPLWEPTPPVRPARRPGEEGPDRSLPLDTMAAKKLADQHSADYLKTTKDSIEDRGNLIAKNKHISLGVGSVNFFVKHPVSNTRREEPLYPSLTRPVDRSVKGTEDATRRGGNHYIDDMRKLSSLKMGLAIAAKGCPTSKESHLMLDSEQERPSRSNCIGLEKMLGRFEQGSFEQWTKVGLPEHRNSNLSYRPECHESPILTNTFHYPTIFSRQYFCEIMRKLAKWSGLLNLAYLFVYMSS